MAKNYVCNGAKIECKLCTKPEGTLKVTSNEIKVQDKLFATEGDNTKANLIFEGNCKKSWFQASPCASVIQLEKWQGVADLIVQDKKALFEDSTIMCVYGGVPITITDHLQKSKPKELQPVAAPVIGPNDEPMIFSLEWKSNKEGKDKEKIIDVADEVIEKTVVGEKIWLEACTMGILPGEKIKFELTLEQENSTAKLLETSATVQSDGSVFIQLKSEDSEGKSYKVNAKAIYDENTTAEAKIEILPLPKVIVDFRPNKDYDGEYGFDYMREVDKKDSITYKDILGTNKAKVDGKWIDKFKKYTTDTKYNSLKVDHYGAITFPWHKDAKGKEIEYIQSWLTIYPKETQTLSLQIDTLEKNDQDLNLEYDKTLFKLNTEVVPAQSKSKNRLKDHLTVECLKEFDKPQTIKVMLGSTQFGQLNILPNAKAKRKKAQVVFVKVTTKISSKSKTGSTTNKTGKPEKDMLERYLKQAYIKLELAEEDFDLTLPDSTTKKLKYPDFNKNYTLIDVTDTKKPNILNKYNNTAGGDGLAEYMEKIYNAEMPQYKNYFKVFFFGETGGRKDKTVKIQKLAGHAKDFNSLCAILYAGKSKATVTHELLHAMGLKHSFSDSADYGYKKKATENIMDYSTTRKNTWLWQWKKLWTNTDLKNE